MAADHAFSPRVRRILQALCDRLFDPGRDDRTSPSDIELAEMMSRGMSETPSMNRLGLSLLLTVLNWAPLLFLGRFSRFIRLSVEHQTRFVDKVLHHPLRPVRLAMTALFLMASVYYWEHPQVLAEIGYDGLDLLPPEGEGTI